MTILNRPLPTRLAAIWRTVNSETGERITDPREFWEALAARGLIPMDWVEDQDRWFHCDACVPNTSPGGPRFDPNCGDAHCWTHPPTVADAITLASDPDRVVTAERLVDECLPSTRYVWRVLNGPIPPKHVHTRGLIGVGLPPGKSASGMAVTARRVAHELAGIGVLAEVSHPDCVVLVTGQTRNRSDQ